MIGKLFIISAPSGAGKTTLANAILNKFQSVDLRKVVTYTSRKPYYKEIHGIDYYFISEYEFIEKIKQDYFLEYSTAYFAYYGFPKYILNYLNLGKSYLAILDLNGAINIKKKFENAILIWIEPPSIEELENRLIIRNRDNIDAIKQRLDIAKKELDNIEKDLIFDYKIINTDLSKTLFNLENIFKNKLLKNF